MSTRCGNRGLCNITAHKYYYCPDSTCGDSLCEDGTEPKSVYVLTDYIPPKWYLIYSLYFISGTALLTIILFRKTKTLKNNHLPILAVHITSWCFFAYFDFDTSISSAQPCIVTQLFSIYSFVVAGTSKTLRVYYHIQLYNEQKKKVSCEQETYSKINNNNYEDAVPKVPQSSHYLDWKLTHAVVFVIVIVVTQLFITLMFTEISISDGPCSQVAHHVLIKYLSSITLIAYSISLMLYSFNKRAFDSLDRSYELSIHIAAFFITSSISQLVAVQSAMWVEVPGHITPFYEFGYYTMIVFCATDMLATVYVPILFEVYRNYKNGDISQQKFDSIFSGTFPAIQTGLLLNYSLVELKVDEVIVWSYLKRISDPHIHSNLRSKLCEMLQQYVRNIDLKGMIGTETFPPHSLQSNIACENMKRSLEKNHIRALCSRMLKEKNQLINVLY
ncbi:mthl3 [Acrasis kona]|uniref:Mthl3 n=1 Tax=Acrasis kona TaxID=1008807 RepID=A0AAW2YRA8_9EUKA